MSNNNSPESQGSKCLQNKSKVALFCTLLTIIFMAMAFGIGYYWGKQQVQNNTNSLGNANESTPAAIPLPPASDEIYNYSGEITTIEGQIIDLGITTTNDQGVITKTLKVTTNDQTSFIKRGAGYIPLPGQEIPTEEISLTDLKVGDNITVTAEENIKDKLEFTATKVQLNS